ncbi:MAG TPA: hypothetical protein VHK01_21430, partial [Lacipirellulaceae bacterium]|nr:hypothetical protein [Lacipirellulaceae bacterium]
MIRYFTTGCTSKDRRRYFRPLLLIVFSVVAREAYCSDGASQQTSATATRFDHPRLYLTAQDLPQLRAQRNIGHRRRIWRNLQASADWCLQQQPRTEWIPTAAVDPQYENLYDRFYAAMHDLAIVETLAFASVLSDPNSDPYFEHARDWLLAAGKVWQNEATNSPDASKAYAVLRITKGMAVSYDLLFDRLTPAERDDVRATIVSVLDAYYSFFQAPGTAGEGYNKHHGSVDAAPFGIAALALLGEVPQAEEWLQLAVDKHVDYLLPEALTPSGTNDQSSNFWASTLLYRILFMDALHRVTGRDLLEEFPRALPGRIALAAVTGRQPAELTANECNRSVLFGPNYGQLNYWSPVLLYLAGTQKRPIYQHLALWDEALGGIQRTRFITPKRHEELLFGNGHYALLWYDERVPAEIEPNLPLAFEFPEPEVNEAYLRSSYEVGALVVGMKKGGLVVHAGGRAVLVDQLPTNDTNKPAEPVDEMLVADDGRTAMIRCVGPDSAGIAEQLIELSRPGQLTIDRKTSQSMSWWYMESPELTAQTLRWPDGVEITVEKGRIAEHKADGYTESP